MPDPPFAVLESLLCSETLSPDSPTGSLITTGSFLEERRSRILLMDYDETLYGERALVQKLLDQKISLDVSCWGKVIRTRRDCWHRAYQVHLNHDISQESLQMAISFVDRFVKIFREDYDGEIETTPMDCIFEASLLIVEQLLDDGAVQCVSPIDRKNPDNVQLTVKMMLDVTRWDVIDCTPASFVPHFMEEAGVRQFGGAVLHQQILAVTTLFMIDEKTAAHVPPSSMAALAVAFQSWLVVDSAFTSQTAEVFASTGMSHPSEFLRITVGALLVSGRMSLNYFLRMADFAMSNLYATQFHDGLDVLTAWRFAQLMKELFGALAQLEEACLPVVKQDDECMEVCLESRSGIPSAGSG